jgi:tripartite-type tricarboxylate transporter receptor subunit TctC
LTILPHLQPQNVKVNTLTEFEPIAGIANIPTFFAVPSTSSIKTIDDLIVQTRKEPDRIHYASGGIGSPQHLAGEMFNAYANVKLIHVPYRGASQATLAVASGEVQVMPMALSLAKPFLADKRIRLIGYCGSERHPQYPAIATLIEQGVKSYDYSSWIALFAQKGIPAAALTELRKQTAAVVNDSVIQEKMVKAGLDPWPKTPEQLSKVMQADYTKWQKIIKDANIQST